MPACVGNTITGIFLRQLTGEDSREVSMLDGSNSEMCLQA
jgi:hypothetical protein